MNKYVAPVPYCTLHSQLSDGMSTDDSTKIHHRCMMHFAAEDYSIDFKVKYH